MKLYSTNNKDLRVSFQEAVFNSLPQDKGLYMPVFIPKLDSKFIDNIEHYSFQEIALEIANLLIGEDIPKNDLEKIIQDSLNFDAPLQFLNEKTAVLELFHGPSYAFKDFGARFMSRIMGYFSKKGDQLLDVLVATSGDTGGAVALGFLGVEGIRVTILYPKGKVSKVQEKQLSTNGQNIRALEVDGTFDDCQTLVKLAFNDKELNQKLRLTSANSINIARLIPQTFYYFWAYAQLKTKGKKNVIFSVPSGNFGNIGAGLLAHKMGLPVEHFVAGTNQNDTVPQFLATGNYQAKPSVQTLSNAMDVGNPSNWVRILDMFDQNTEKLNSLIKAYTYNDDETINGMYDLWNKYHYIACPHTAIAYLAAEEDQKKWNKNATTVFLSTAHPCKFPDAIDSEIYEKITLPKDAESLTNKTKTTTELEIDFDQFKQYLLNNK